MPRMIFPHPEFVSKIHSEPERGSPSGRDPSTLSDNAPTASIIPGGGDGFSPASSSTAWRNRSLVSTFSPIHVEGESNAYQVKDPNSASPQLAYMSNADTGAPLPSDRYVQRNSQGQWVSANPPPSTATAISVTPVKLPGDPLNYVIKNASDTRTPQPLFIQNADGHLKQTTKMGMYDGDGGVELDDGLKGGNEPHNSSADVAAAEDLHRETLARYNAAQRDVEVATRASDRAQRAVDTAYNRVEMARDRLDRARHAGASAARLSRLEWMLSLASDRYDMALERFTNAYARLLQAKADRSTARSENTRARQQLDQLRQGASP